MEEVAQQLLQQPDLARDIAVNVRAGSRDTLRFRKETDAPRGTIGWTNGEDLHQAAKRLLLAGAKTYVTPYRRYRQKFGQFAGRYLDGVLMGPNGAGSFVVTALAPVHTRVPVNRKVLAAPQTSHEIDMPESREVTIKVVESLQTSVEALADFRNRQCEQEASAFTERIAGGLSYDLVTALLGMIDASSESSISVDWSAADAGAAVPSSLDKSFTFAPHDYSALERAAVRLATEESPRRVVRA